MPGTRGARAAPRLGAAGAGLDRAARHAQPRHCPRRRAPAARPGRRRARARVLQPGQLRRGGEQRGGGGGGGAGPGEALPVRVCAALSARQQGAPALAGDNTLHHQTAAALCTVQAVGTALSPATLVRVAARAGFSSVTSFPASPGMTMFVLRADPPQPAQPAQLLGMNN